jgi:hypothetical protein
LKHRKYVPSSKIIDLNLNETHRAVRRNGHDPVDCGRKINNCGQYICMICGHIVAVAYGERWAECRMWKTTLLGKKMCAAKRMVEKYR